MFHHKINSHSTLNKDALLPTGKDMERSQEIPLEFLRQIILDVNHIKTGRSYPTRFYNFKDATSHPILTSYTASDRLNILEFN